VAAQFRGGSQLKGAFLSEEPGQLSLVNPGFPRQLIQAQPAVRNGLAELVREVGEVPPLRPWSRHVPTRQPALSEGNSTGILPAGPPSVKVRKSPASPRRLGGLFAISRHPRPRHRPLPP